MRSSRRRRARKADAELDITSFLNLMIVLVPVLLVSMVFSHTRVLDLLLPGSSAGSNQAAVKRLELQLDQNSMTVFYPQGVTLQRFDHIDGQADYAALSTYLQRLKATLREQGTEHRSITLLSHPDTDYQTLIFTMDAVRAYPALVDGEWVQAELFPVISLADAETPAEAAT